MNEPAAAAASTAGTATLLGYRASPPNPLQRALRTVSATRPASEVLAHTLDPVERLLARASGHRVTAPALVALPAIYLTTTGARSGAPRTCAVVPVVHDGDLAVLGTNFGASRTPGWVHNLLADSRALVEYAGRTLEVVARVPDEAERRRIDVAADRTYRGFTAYRRRASRPIRAFVLEAVGGDPAEPR